MRLSHNSSQKLVSRISLMWLSFFNGIFREFSKMSLCECKPTTPRYYILSRPHTIFYIIYQYPMKFSDIFLRIYFLVSCRYLRNTFFTRVHTKAIPIASADLMKIRHRTVKHYKPLQTKFQCSNLCR